MMRHSPFPLEGGRAGDGGGGTTPAETQGDVSQTDDLPPAHTPIPGPPPLEGEGRAGSLKAALRDEAVRRRAHAHAADPDAGSRLRLPSGRRPPPCAVVAGYHPFRTEIDPRPLMAALEAAGCLLALPCTPARGSGAGLVFRRLDPAHTLATSTFGVPEPPENAPLVMPDLVLVPLLAFDRTGARLGYGAGHYDRTLPALAARPGFRAVGLAYAAQEVERLPVEPHDAPLDGILTERAYILTR